ncbi:MAG: aminotransferase class I/II-fold pyridoxal phosphate-dependent enzyme [Lachnospiraceae bacterium]|nr:aminotransferase class I/II-fold pyridoxal phosphate-dependent enzyme [Lachnospiraceae bacterium]
MILFQCDYNEGVHPRILERLISTNEEQTVGYGEDEYCEKARDMIRRKCKDSSLAVHFLVGGTQANLTVIDAALRSHQGVLCAVSGHINVHETGAVEACGHKVMGLASGDGKITAMQVKDAYNAHVEDSSFEHMVQPKMVYISNPTELGTIYSKQELQELYAACKECGFYLFLDGARLGYGLAAPDNDMTMEDIAANTDVFYIGGTKVGALFGEAVVISNETLKKDFRYFIKQRGGMLAKGRLLGIQFEELMKDGLYEEISAHAISLAERLRGAFEAQGYSYLVKNRTNQIFVIMPDAVLEKIKSEVGFSYQQRVDETHSAVRFCTSWATKEENVERLIAILERV